MSLDSEEDTTTSRGRPLAMICFMTSTYVSFPSMFMICRSSFFGCDISKTLSDFALDRLYFSDSTFEYALTLLSCNYTYFLSL